MKEEISFVEELEDLRKAGFTEEQVGAIWHLVAQVTIKIITMHERIQHS